MERKKNPDAVGGRKRSNQQQECPTTQSDGLESHKIVRTAKTHSGLMSTAQAETDLMSTAQAETDLMSTAQAETDLMSTAQAETDLMSTAQAETDLMSTAQAETDLMSTAQAETDFMSTAQAETDLMSTAQAETDLMSTAQAETDLMSTAQAETDLMSTAQAETDFMSTAQAETDLMSTAQAETDLMSTAQAETDLMSTAQAETDFMSTGQPEPDLLSTGQPATESMSTGQPETEPLSTEQSVEATGHQVTESEGTGRKRGRPVKRGKKSVAHRVRSTGGTANEARNAMRKSEKKEKETNLASEKKRQYKKTRKPATNNRTVKRKLNFDDVKVGNAGNSVKSKKHFLNKVFAHDPQVYGFPSKNMTVAMQKALKHAFERKSRHGSMGIKVAKGKRYLRCVKRRDYVKELKADEVTLELKAKEYRYWKKKLARKEKELPKAWKTLKDKAGSKIARVLKKKQKRDIKYAATFKEIPKIKRKLDNAMCTIKTLKYKHAYWNEMFKIRQQLNDQKKKTMQRKRFRTRQKTHATKVLQISRKSSKKFRRKEIQNMSTKLTVAKILDRVHGTKVAQKLKDVAMDKRIQKEILNYAGSGDRMQEGTESERNKKQANFMKSIVEGITHRTLNLSLKKPTDGKDKTMKDIRNEVDKAAGGKDFLVKQFWYAYYKLMEKLSNWKAKLEEKCSEDKDDTKTTWYEILRPPESQIHRTYERDLEMMKKTGKWEKGKCTDECDLPQKWAERVHAKLNKLKDPNEGIEKCMESLVNLEHCKYCKTDGTCLRGIDACKDAIRIMLRVKPHSTTVTNFLKDLVYPVRRLMGMIRDMDNTLLKGTITDLKDINGKVMEMRAKLPDNEHILSRNFTGPEVKKEKMEEEFGELFKLYLEKLRDHPVHTCYFCERNVRKSQIAKTINDISTLRKENWETNIRHMLSKLLEDTTVEEVDEIVKDMEEPISICDQCWKGILKKAVTGAMLLNNMGVDDMPEELKCLNFFEKVMVERARAVYSVVKLETYSKYRNKNKQNLVDAVKGNSVHMWNATGETSSYVLKTMPAKSLNDRLRVFARSLPTKKQVIYENLIDMKKVLKALEYLKANNLFYKDVVIDGSNSTVSWQEIVNVQYEKEVNKEQPDSTKAITKPKESDTTDKKPESTETKEIVQPIEDEMEWEPDDPLEYFELQQRKEIQYMAKMRDQWEQEMNDAIRNEFLNAEMEYEASMAMPPPDETMEDLTEWMETEDETDNVKQAPELTSMLMDMWEPEAYAQFVLRSTEDNQVKAGEHLKTYQQTKTEMHCLNFYDTPGLDVMCLPQLFPTGRGGLDDKRKKKVRPREYCQYRLAHDSGRFRRSPKWLQMMYFLKRERAMNQGMYASLKTGSKLNGMTAKMFKGKVKAGDVDAERDLKMAFATVKGTKEYWNRQCGDLRAMDEQIGPATFFVTLSCAEYAWPELEDYLREVNKDLENVKEMTKDELIHNDPVSVSEFFMRKFTAFMDHVILAKDKKGRKQTGPLGYVEDYYWRLEYQARGAPHVHMKLWIKDAPVIGKNTEEEVLEFIAKHIRADIPKEVDNLELHQLVSQYQMHKCSNYCKIKTKGNKEKWFSRCKFGFPQEESKNYNLLGVKESVMSRKPSSKQIKKHYEVPRSKNDVNVNAYNPAILMLWKANMDIQYVGEESNTLNSYITGYVTKGENKSTKGLWDSVSEDNNAPASILSMMKQRFREREVGMYEIADEMLGNSLHKASKTVLWCGAGLPEKRSRKAKPQKFIDMLPDGSTDLLMPNLIEYYYPQRPKKLESTSLFDFVKYWTYVKIKQQNNKTDQEKDMEQDDSDEDMESCVSIDGKFECRKRKNGKFAIVKTKHVALTEQTSEEYYQLLLQLHLPYRNETELKQGNSTFEEAFTTLISSENSEIGQRLKMEHEIKEKRRTFKELAKQWEEEADMEDKLDENTVATGQSEEVEEGYEDLHAMTGNVKGNSDYGTDEGLRDRVDSLNQKQRQAYDTIMNTIEQQQNRSNGNCNNELTKDQILTFISGGAGVGKSKLIQTITEGIEIMAKKNGNIPNPVVLSAPTGMAARNIGGATLHSIFKLPRQTKTNWEYKRATPEQEKAIYQLIGKSILIIVDEVSMVSNRCLAFVHLRCCDVLAKPYTEPFGGLNVVVLGDMLQLPPVGLKSEKSAPYCFTKMTKEIMTKAFPESASKQFPVFLWEHFDYKELTENMRQKDDQTYADMLNEIRIGKVTEDTLKALKSRTGKCTLESAAQLVVQLRKEGKEPTCLMPLRKQVTDVNIEAMTQERIEPILLHATDISRGGRRISNKKTQTITGKETANTVKNYMKKHNNKDSKDTGGLENVVVLGIGAPVMLTRNVNVAEGLYNGATGKVTNIIRNKQSPDGISEIEVQIEGKKVRIERQNVTYITGKAVSIERNQFPLTLSYAITVHKSQGLSLNCVVADLGEKVFEHGMIYVVLSRLRKLEGLYLLDFDEDYVMADPRAVEEYNRLRTEYEKDLDLLDVPARTNFGHLKRKSIRVMENEMKQHYPKHQMAESELAKKASPTKKLKVTDVNIGSDSDEEEETVKMTFASSALKALESTSSYMTWLKGRCGKRVLKAALKDLATSNNNQTKLKTVVRRLDELASTNFSDGKMHYGEEFVTEFVSNAGKLESAVTIDSANDFGLNMTFDGKEAEVVVLVLKTDKQLKKHMTSNKRLYTWDKMKKKWEVKAVVLRRQQDHEYFYGMFTNEKWIMEPGNNGKTTVEYMMMERCKETPELIDQVTKKMAETEIIETQSNTNESKYWEDIMLHAWEQHQSLEQGTDYYNIPLLKPENRIIENIGCKRKGKVRYNGREMLAYDVRGDGNCLYRAISCAVQGSEEHYMNYRIDMANWLKENWRTLDNTEEEAKNMVIGAYIDATNAQETEAEIDEMLETLCELIRKDKEWAGISGLSFASKMLNLSFVIVDSELRSIYRIGERIRNWEPKAEVYLRFKDGNHYQVLIPAKRSMKLTEL